VAGRVLALDLGAARVGVAVSDATAVLASPLTTLRAGDHWAIARLVEEEGVALVLVGLPRNMDGSHGPAARAAEAEAGAIAATLAVPVVLVDERLTTVSADRALRAQGGRKGPARRRVVDRAAAAVLLQGWLDGGEGARWRAGGTGSAPPAHPAH
jgi:putative Holliday junction resolvase